MSIRIQSSIDEAYLNSTSSAGAGNVTSDIEVSFSDALASAQSLLASTGLDQAEKNAVRAVTVDAAVDAIRQNGGFGLSLDSALAKSLGLNAPAGLTGNNKSDTSSIQVESAEDAARRNAAATASATTADASDTTASQSGAVSDTHAASGSTAAATSLGDELSCSDTLEEYFEEASSTYEVSNPTLTQTAPALQERWVSCSLCQRPPKSLVWKILTMPTRTLWAVPS